MQLAMVTSFDQESFGNMPDCLKMHTAWHDGCCRSVRSNDGVHVKGKRGLQYIAFSSETGSLFDGARYHHIASSLFTISSQLDAKASLSKTANSALC